MKTTLFLTSALLFTAASPLFAQESAAHGGKGGGTEPGFTLDIDQANVSHHTRFRVYSAGHSSTLVAAAIPPSAQPTAQHDDSAHDTAVFPLSAATEADTAATGSPAETASQDSDDRKEGEFTLHYGTLSLNRNHRFQARYTGHETVAGKSWSLNNCLQLALQKNPGLLALDRTIDQRRQEIYAALGAFFPTLSAQYNATDFNSDDYEEERGGGRSSLTNSLVLTLTQPVFNGFSGINRLRHAALQKESDHYRRRLMRQRLIADIRTSYYNKLAAEAVRKNYQQSLDRLLEQLKISQAWVGQKLAPPLRVLEVKTRIAETRYQLSAARSNEATALSALRSAMMLPPDTAVRLSDSLNTPLKPICADRDRCAAMAARRPELTMAALAVDIARQNAHLTIARNLPEASITASWARGTIEYDKPYQTGANLSHSEEDNDHWSVGFSLTFTPFQGGQNLFAWRAQKKNVASLELQLEQSYQDISNEIETRFLQREEALAAIAPAEEAVKEARLAWKMNFKFVKLGIVSLDDLLDAELELTRARNNLTEARRRLRLAETNLALASGDTRAVGLVPIADPKTEADVPLAPEERSNLGLPANRSEPEPSAPSTPGRNVDKP